MRVCFFISDDQEDGDIPEELEDLFGQAGDPSDEPQVSAL